MQPAKRQTCWQVTWNACASQPAALMRRRTRTPWVQTGTLGDTSVRELDVETCAREAQARELHLRTGGGTFQVRGLDFETLERCGRALDLRDPRAGGSLGSRRARRGIRSRPRLRSRFRRRPRVRPRRRLRSGLRHDARQHAAHGFEALADSGIDLLEICLGACAGVSAGVGVSVSVSVGIAEIHSSSFAFCGKCSSSCSTRSSPSRIARLASRTARRPRHRSSSWRLRDPRLLRQSRSPGIGHAARSPARAHASVPRVPEGAPRGARWCTEIPRVCSAETPRGRRCSGAARSRDADRCEESAEDDASRVAARGALEAAAAHRTGDRA